ncbi:hypothetical protein LCGC14_1732720 [marine sediment metagenome]|uniref:Uncharacterized protein n=1 Tax=marine sediment metagenome TaxID=412755 RepID=A0A0F9H8V2_9ZZZZ
MKCPKCGYKKMWQFPHNKLMISCPECNTQMRNPKYKEQTSFEEGGLVKWQNTIMEH